MKRLCFFLLAALLMAAPPAAQARDQKVRDVDIELTVRPDGSVLVHERWDVDTGDGITEWYLVRENLGDIRISGFRVRDGVTPLQDEGKWEVDRTLAQKAGRYGIVQKSNGCELCWGIGSYGDHVFDVSYTMERALKSLNDYDMLHLQVVSPGLAAPPRHARVRVKAEGAQLDTANTRFWGFGFKGHSAMDADGTVFFETSGAMGTDDSVIVLLRFDKGLFHSPSVREEDFQQALDRAMKGAKFKDDSKLLHILLLALAFFVIFIWPALRGGRLKLGFKPKDVSWYREAPLGGSLLLSNYIQSQSGHEPKGASLPLAIILRLVQRGSLEVSRAVQGKAELRFTDKALEGLEPAESGLYQMLKESAGPDGILQDKEFSKWAKAHDTRVYQWAHDAEEAAATALQQRHWLESRKHALTVGGRQEAKHLFGLKKFLQEFTLIDAREAAEATLWRDYMAFGALFGITGRVAAQLKDIDPALFKETLRCEYNDFPSVLASGESMSRSISTASTTGSPNYSSRSGSGGHGGTTSRGGGGGFSGGGRGGGGR